MSPFSSPPPVAPSAIRNELDAGERVLWTGQPAPEALARRASGIGLSGLAGFAFALFWTAMTLSIPARSQNGVAAAPDLMRFVFPLIGVSFVCYSGWIMLTPLVEYLRAPRTFYALTDRRALIVVEGARSNVRSVLPSEFAIERSEKSDGRGDLVFKRELQEHGAMYFRNRTGLYTKEIGFFGIYRAREVERLARQLAA